MCIPRAAHLAHDDTHTQTYAVMGFARLHASGDYWYIRCSDALEPTNVTAVS